VVSWRNPDASCADITWDDYIDMGVMTAISTALIITGADKVNALGWCVGGTMLSSALAVMRSRGDQSVASLTLLTTMLDFHDPGELGVFIDEFGVQQREQTIGRGGIYPGAELGFVFQTLRDFWKRSPCQPISRSNEGPPSYLPRERFCWMSAQTPGVSGMNTSPSSSGFASSRQLGPNAHGASCNLSSVSTHFGGVVKGRPFVTASAQSFKRS